MIKNYRNIYNDIGCPKKNWATLLLLIGFHSLILGQDINQAISEIKNNAFQKAVTTLNKIDTVPYNKEEKALYYFYLGYSQNRLDRQDLAYQNIIKSKKLYLELNKKIDVKDCNLQILDILSHQNDSKVDIQPFVDEINEFIEDFDNPDNQIYFKLYKEIAGNFLSINRVDDAKNILEKSLSLSSELGDSVQAALDQMNLGVVAMREYKYDEVLRLDTSALNCLLITKDSINIANNYNNQGQAYKEKKQFIKAEELYKKALATLPDDRNRKKSQLVYYTNMVDLYDRMGDYKNAFTYTKIVSALEDSINDKKQDLAITDINEKYNNEKLRADNLEIEKQKTKNQIIAIALGGGLLAVSLIGFLAYKNTKRKQRIAEQEKQLEIQEKETLLKEQEINTINAMVEGQEKERQRVASDLHDSIGATLSAAKLQFDHLNKHKNSEKNLEELFQKTSTLLEEAYQEVRSMAHLKNSGVLAKNGLLPALEKLAKNASTNDLNFEIEHFGLERRLDNDKEIALFRILQELVTNIIKHAQATEATISLTQRDDMLSIIVEDNGIGFEKHKLNAIQGMGLTSLEKRIEHWEGSLEVDTSPGNGTNILIDIPL